MWGEYGTSGQIGANKGNSSEIRPNIGNLFWGKIRVDKTKLEQIITHHVWKMRCRGGGGGAGI